MYLKDSQGNKIEQFELNDIKQRLTSLDYKTDIYISTFDDNDNIASAVKTKKGFQLEFSQHQPTMDFICTGSNHSAEKALQMFEAFINNDESFWGLPWEPVTCIHPDERKKIIVWLLVNFILWVAVIMYNGFYFNNYKGSGLTPAEIDKVLEYSDGLDSQYGETPTNSEIKAIAEKKYLISCITYSYAGMQNKLHKAKWITNTASAILFFNWLAIGILHLTTLREKPKKIT
ncbi:MAG: hypothetical protein JEZ07_15825 [Phycisphaerae bacterium]|nr:hypothetical protein [Phycisphaerae bacterium]